MSAETIPYRGLTIVIDSVGGDYAAKVRRPDGSEVLTHYAPSRDGAVQDAKANIQRWNGLTRYRNICRASVRFLLFVGTREAKSRIPRLLGTIVSELGNPWRFTVSSAKPNLTRLR